MKNKREIIESKYPPVNNEDLWLKDGKLYHSTSQGWVPLSEEPSITETYEQGVSSISYSGKDGKEHLIELSENVESDVTDIINDTFVTDEDNNITFTDDNDTEHTLVTTDTLPSILADNNMLEVTWLLLKDKRDNSQLTPGCLYRITDYNCTTTQENTQSAGHQFDIVLLALSANKLAEEGWAMMNESNIYDVTFGDGVTLKCYLYFFDDETDCNIVLVADTSIGRNLGVGKEDLYVDGAIDEENKTLLRDGFTSNEFLTEGESLPYNYFQNSKLEAWKVWYCLDNDTARFAWADDDSSPSIYSEDYGFWLVRDASKDVLNKYAWYNSSDETTLLTDNLEPKIGDTTYDVEGNVDGNVSKLKGFGRGVIYRLIDEWNNDVPCDFKNILFLRTTNIYNAPDPQGQSAEYFYTFSLINDSDNHKILDASMFAKDFLNDEEREGMCHNNYISAIDEYSAKLNMRNIFILPDIILVQAVLQNDNTSCFTYNKFNNCYNITLLGNLMNLTFIESSNIISEQFYELIDTIIMKVWNKTITHSWNYNIVKTESNVMKKASFVNL